ANREVEVSGRNGERGRRRRQRDHDSVEAEETVGRKRELLLRSARRPEREHPEWIGSVRWQRCRVEDLHVPNGHVVVVRKHPMEPARRRLQDGRGHEAGGGDWLYVVNHAASRTAANIDGEEGASSRLWTRLAMETGAA